MAGRRLSPDEAALWKRVSGTVRNMRSQAERTVEARPRSAVAESPLPQAGGDFLASKPATVSNRKNHSNTLDGSWDRKIGTGQLTPERTIDLHGHNLASAHHRLDRGLDDAVRDGVRIILLVTGHAPRIGGSRIDLPMRGIIRDSVGDWLAVSRHNGAIAAVRNAHPRHGGAGALYLILRRSR
jgi:DNA-nicking Smr family endonuclease